MTFDAAKAGEKLADDYLAIRARGGRTHDDGQSRPFDDASTDPRHVIARTLAEYDGWAEIRPGHWRQAGRAVQALKDREMLAPRRRKVAS